MQPASVCNAFQCLSLSLSSCSHVDIAACVLHPPFFLLRSIQNALALAQDPSSQGQAIRNAFVLLAFFVSFRILVYLVLRRKTARL